MIRRRELIAGIGGMAVLWPRPARAQQPEKVWRIGVLETVSQALNTTNMDAFQQGDIPMARIRRSRRTDQLWA
jgi:hypothetical protein